MPILVLLSHNAQSEEKVILGRCTISGPLCATFPYIDFSMCSPVGEIHPIQNVLQQHVDRVYCSQLWRDYKSSSIKQLIVGYNHSFRFIMNYHRNCSASGMFVFNSIPSFMELWRNYIYGFMQRFNNSDNTIVAATVSSCRLSSAMWRRWESILYTKTSCLQ